MINCDVELDLLWLKDCALIEHYNNITSVDFKIASAKLYGHVVILSIQDNTEFLEHLKQDLEEHFLEINIDLKLEEKQKKNNSDYMIDLTFKNVSRLFVVSFKK